MRQARFTCLHKRRQLGLQILNLRLAAGLSQQQLADLLGDVSQETICKIETARIKDVNLFLVIAICEALETKLSKLIDKIN